MVELVCGKCGLGVKDSFFVVPKVSLEKFRDDPEILLDAWFGNFLTFLESLTFVRKIELARAMVKKLNGCLDSWILKEE